MRFRLQRPLIALDVISHPPDINRGQQPPINVPLLVLVCRSGRAKRNPTQYDLPFSDFISFNPNSQLCTFINESQMLNDCYLTTVSGYQHPFCPAWAITPSQCFFAGVGHTRRLLAFKLYRHRGFSTKEKSPARMLPEIAGGASFLFYKQGSCTHKASLIIYPADSKPARYFIFASPYHACALQNSQDLQQHVIVSQGHGKPCGNVFHAGQFYGGLFF